MGEIATFYSFKGGTGRSMALANTAILLARQGKRVLMIDWDLEAPGLDAYFVNCHPNINKAQGLIEFLEFSNKNLDKMTYGNEIPEQLIEVFLKIKERYALQLALPAFPEVNGLFLLKSGDTRGESYQRKIHKFNWKSFFNKIPAFFTFLAEYLSKEYDYVLIDSRTGHTDMSSICTALMPEKLVLVFTPNEQSLQGVLTIAKNATAYRIKTDDLRPLIVYPLPSRVDLAEEELKKEWESKYTVAFEKLFQEIYGLNANISLVEYFNHVQIRYASRMAYGEYLATMEFSSGPNSLSENYEKFVAQFVRDNAIWNYKPNESPYEMTFIYDEKAKNILDELLLHLRPLQRSDVLRWDDDNRIPFEKWDTILKKRLADKKDNQLVLVLIDKHIQDNKYYDLEVLSSIITKKNGNSIIQPIWINGQLQEETLQLFNGKLILPNRRIPLQDLQDKDNAWINIISELKRQINKPKRTS